jgi:hypothetical protein
MSHVEVVRHVGAVAEWSVYRDDCNLGTIENEPPASNDWYVMTPQGGAVAVRGSVTAVLRHLGLSDAEVAKCARQYRATGGHS